MPKRVIDFDAMWGSDKLAACAPWAQAEYAWLYGLADASGCFEMTNLRVIWGRVAAIRTNLTLERLEQVFAEFQDKGLMFVWEHEGKRYAHWTGSDVPGRLPPPSWRMRLEKFAPPVPKQKLAEYMAKFARGRAALGSAGFRAETECENFKCEISNFGQKQLPPPREEAASSGSGLPELRLSDPQEPQKLAAPGERPTGSTLVPANAHCRAHGRAAGGLKAGLEEAQAQDLNWNLEGDGKGNWEQGQERPGRPPARAECAAEEKQTSQRPLYGNSNSKASAAAERSSNRNSSAGAESLVTRNGAPGSMARPPFPSPTRAQPRGETQFCSGRDFAARMTAFLRSEKEAAVERELRVGQAPVCDPSLVKPEAIERERRRQAARAAARGR